MAANIKSKRLQLRPFTHEDAPRLAALANDIDIARMTALIPHPYPVEVAEGWIFLLAASGLGAGRVLAIEARGEGLIGSIGVFKRNREADWEVGYWIGQPYWGRGYASEALTPVLIWARVALGAQRIVASYFEDNPASERVLAKTGFHHLETTSSLYSLGRNAQVQCIDMEWRPAAGPEAGASSS